jgi:hypothetical protein
MTVLGYFNSLRELGDGRRILEEGCGRDWGDSTPAAELAAKFADRLWTKGWPGERRPDVFCDPRSLKGEGETAVLHAKAVVVDDAVAFVTSANRDRKVIRREHRGRNAVARHKPRDEPFEALPHPDRARTPRALPA